MKSSRIKRKTLPKNGRARKQVHPRTKRIKTSVNQSPEWQEAIFEGSRDAIFISDANSRFVAVNGAACKLTGYSKDELLNMQIPDLHDEPDLEAFKTYHERILAGEEVLSEAKILCKDGSKVDTEFSNTQILISGTPFMHTVARDITELKRADKALLDSEKHFRALIENSSDAIALVSAEGKIVYRSPAAYRLVGQDPAVRRDSSLFSTVHSDDRQEAMKCFAQIIQIPTEAVAFQYRVRHADGSWHWIEGTGINLLSEPAVHAIVVNYRDVTERKQKDIMLKESQEKVQKVFDSSPDAILLIDLNGIISECNQTAAHLYRCSTKEELVGTNGFNLVVESERQRAIQLLQELRSRRTMHGVELTMVRSDGSLFAAETAGNVLQDPSGRTTGLVVIVTDISARKQAEKELAYRAELLNQVHDAIVASDKNYMLTAWNAGAEILYGWKAEEVLGRNGLEIVRTDWPEVDAEEMRLMITKTGRWRGEATQARKDGTRFPVEVSSMILYDETEAVTGYVSVIRDITERKRAEKELQESEAKYRDLIERAYDAIFVVDTKGDIVLVNRRACEMFGYAEDELLKLNIADTYPAEDKNVCRERMALLREGKHLLYERTSVRKDGTVFPVDVTTSLLPNGTMQGIVRDITERKQAEEKIIALARFPSENPYPVLRLGRDGTVLFANEASEALLKNWGCSVGGYAPTFWREKITEAFTSQSKRTLDVQLGEQTYSFVVAPVADECYVNLYGRDITDRKQAEAKIQEDYSTLTGIINSTAAAIFSLDVSYRYTSFNTAHAAVMKALYGGVIEVGKSIYDFQTVPEDAAKSKANIDRAMRGERFIEEAYSGNEARSRRFFEVAHNPIYSAEGQVVGVAVFAQDITERKRAEEERSRLARLVDSSPASITIHDSNGRFLYANQKTFEMHGYTREEFMAINLHQLDIPESEQLIEQRMHEIRDHGEATFESSHLRKDGSSLPLHINVKLSRWGNELAFESIAMDITERNRAEEALRKTEEKFRNVIENIFKFVPEGLVVLTDKLNLFKRNKAFEDLVRQYAVKLKYSEEELTDILIEQIKTRLVSGEKSEIRIAGKDR